MNSNINNENISFFLQEKKINNEEDSKEDEIKQMMYELEELIESDNLDLNLKSELRYFINKNFYNNDELYYSHEYNIKDLLKICQYYEIDKNIRSSKCKKQDIISTLVYFESLPENYEVVQERNLAWAYMEELYNNTKMKKYLIWK
uniref:Uncharacterized protein n=1 Tax=viral metagenome TaxID=1070528 RepID=A0A6C0KS77_9ZZZZ